MMKIVVLLIFCVALSSAILLSAEDEWKKFKSLHKKNYLTQEDETYRFQIFKDNLKKIVEHNEKFERGETSYKMGVNQFTDMTSEEFKAIYGRGLLPRHEGEENKPVYA